MAETASSFLAPWESFYVMAGSSAAALTGLMFVVTTLVAGTERMRSSRDGMSTYSTPTVVHFCAALLVSAVLSAPWRSLLHPAALLAVAGLYGVVHVVAVIYRASRLTQYTPDLEDWVWYTLLPLVSYAAMLGGAIALPKVPVNALFALAGVVLLLIFVGIHNAWDIVTYIVIADRDEEPPKAS